MSKPTKFDKNKSYDSHGFIAIVTIANGLYTITDYEGTVLVDGKSTKTKTERPTISRTRERSISMIK